MRTSILYFKALLFCTIVCGLATGCSSVGPAPSVTASATAAGATAGPGTAVPADPANPSQSQPTETPLPQAVRVNDGGVSLEEYQAELRLFQQGGAEPSAAEKQQVLDELIDQELLAQGAAEKGFVVDQALLDQRIQQLGGSQVVQTWMATYGYSPAAFERSLKRSIAAAWMRDQISAAVPHSTEQVHARQILHYNADEARNTATLLQAGNDFGNLALKYDPVAGGDLGWFPRGYLPDQKLEDAAFNLQPEQYSPVIETLAGFHILQVLERDPQRLLAPDALLSLQIKAVQQWLADRRQKSEIQVLAPS